MERTDILNQKSNEDETVEIGETSDEKDYRQYDSMRSLKSK